MITKITANKIINFPENSGHAFFLSGDLLHNLIVIHINGSFLFFTILFLNECQIAEAAVHSFPDVSAIREG